jgi:hypothetical protein
LRAQDILKSCGSAEHGCNHRHFCYGKSMGDQPKAYDLIVVRVPLSLAGKIDHARGRLSRSQFIRDSVGRELKRLRIPVTDEEIQSPDRKGKGGPRKRRPA